MGFATAQKWVERLSQSDGEPAPPGSHAKGRVGAGRLLAGAGLLGLLYFFGLGAPALLDPDEPVYGLVGREMLATGDWLTPHRGGALWFDKPPLFHWAVAASQWLFGSTAFASRFPSAVTACLLLLLVYRVGRHLFSPRAGLFAAAVAGTCVQTIILARAAVTDMLFSTCFAAATCALYLGLARASGVENDERRTTNDQRPMTNAGLQTLAIGRWSLVGTRCRGSFVVGGIALGLATLTKGPVAPALVGAIGILYLLWERQPRLLVSRGVLLMGLAWLLTAGPWYAAMLALHPREFTHDFLVANNLVRFTQPEHRSLSTPLYYFIPVLLVGLFPWSPFLVGALRVALRSSAGRFLLVWVAVVFVFFSLSQTKLVTYIYPLYPAAALLIGAYLGESQSQPEPSSRGERRVVLILAFLLAGLAVALATRQYPASLPAAGLLALVLVVGALLPLIGGQRGWRAFGAALGSGLWALGSRCRGASSATSRLVTSVAMPLHEPRAQSPEPRARAERATVGMVAAYSGMMTAFTLVLFCLLGPGVEQRESTKVLADWARRNGDLPVVGFRVTAPSFEFYTGRNIGWEKLPNRLRQRVEEQGIPLVLTHERELPLARQALAPRRLEVVARAGRRLLARIGSE